MKRVLVGLLLGVLLVGGAWAQGHEKNVEFTLSLGVQTDLSSASSFSDALFTMAANLDVHLGRSVMISPEVMVVTHDFDFGSVIIYPGAILNFKFGAAFIGAGLVLPVLVTSGSSDTGDLSPKINLGVRAGHITLMAYLITNTDEIFKNNLIGASVGVTF
jgi:hypothetical protein